MIGVIVPAHNEAESIAACLASIEVAAADPRLDGEPVVVVVAADACSDHTAALAEAAGACVVTLAGRNVGSARLAASERAIGLGARWLASTDADSLVAPDWLAQQSALSRSGVEAVCGVVEVLDWLDHPPSVTVDYILAYCDVDGHPHVHGACLGVSTATYVAAGGWQRLDVGEDVALVRSIETLGVTVTRSAAVRVVTSARRDARAAGGFGDFLARLGLSA